MTRELTIANRQSSRRLRIRAFRIAILFLNARLEDAPFSIGVHFVGAREMARVNKTYLGHEGSTDVITFDHRDAESGIHAPIHGELFISISDAASQAETHHTHWTDEAVRYFIHGVLHLLGHDDRSPSARRVMKRHENKWMRFVRRESALTQIDGST